MSAATSTSRRFKFSARACLGAALLFGILCPGAARAAAHSQAAESHAAEPHRTIKAPKPPKALKRPKQQIDELEEQWRTATLSGDTTAMDKLLSDDYVGISWTGQVNTKQMQLDRTRTKAISIQNLQLSDIKVKVVGPVAIVTSLATVTGSNDGHPIDGDFRYTRVYQRLPSGLWKITNFEATRIPPPGRDHRRGPPPTQPPPPPPAK